MFIGNPDITAPLESWFSIEPGYFAPGRELAIGDAQHTDVLGAHNAGMHTLLVELDLLRGQESMLYIQESGISRHFLAATIG